ncbi:hypothetical protein [Clostridium baratii]|uniref:hypothetical protein n=1 Tax=Clostridium baratii TaxID=1561 RepID=UPI0030CE0283
MKKYKLCFLEGYTRLVDGAKIRINLLGDTQVEDIKALKGYKVEYCGSIYEDFIKVNKIMKKRKIVYIQVFKEKII